MKIFFIMFTALIFISGCSTENSNEVIIDDEWKAEYDGVPLNIGVIGEKPKRTFNNITIHSAEPDSLKQPEEYDAYFITDQYFGELSQADWKSVLMNIKTPVFFINLDVQAFIYRVEEMNYGDMAPPATEHSNGFVRTGDTFNMWGYAESTDVNETSDWIFNSIFRDIEEYKFH